jgi:hypothetical protein
MSVMRRGDEELHYSDNSHRWIAPGGVEQVAWEVVMRAHLSQHLLTMDGPGGGGGGAAGGRNGHGHCRPPRIPRPRVAPDDLVPVASRGR